MKKGKFILTLSIALCGLSVSSAAKSYRIKDGDIRFSAKAKSQVLKISGEGAKPAGEIQQADQKISGRVKVELKDLTTGIGLRDQHMKNKYLQVDQYPSAELEIQSVDLKTKNFTGLLNLHGTQKPVSGEVTVKSSQKGTDVESHFQIRLSDFQIQTPSFMEIQLLDAVDVTVLMSLEEELTTAAQGSP